MKESKEYIEYLDEVLMSIDSELDRINSELETCEDKVRRLKLYKEDLVSEAVSTVRRYKGDKAAILFKEQNERKIYGTSTV